MRCDQVPPARSAALQRLADLIADLEALDQHGHPTLSMPAVAIVAEGSPGSVAWRWNVLAACLLLVLVAAVWV
jgi:hypothetical protein